MITDGRVQSKKLTALVLDPCDGLDYMKGPFCYQITLEKVTI